MRKGVPTNEKFEGKYTRRRSELGCREQWGDSAVAPEAHHLLIVSDFSLSREHSQL